MADHFFKSVALWTLGLFAGIGAAALFLKNGAWAAGVGVGAAWMILNFFFLFQLIEISLRGIQQKNRILLLATLKFPVLYLAGFFILKTRFFPVFSVLLGLTLCFVALAIVWGRFVVTFRRGTLNA